MDARYDGNFMDYLDSLGGRNSPETPFIVAQASYSRQSCQHSFLTKFLPEAEAIAALAETLGHARWRADKSAQYPNLVPKHLRKPDAPRNVLYLDAMRASNNVHYLVVRFDGHIPAEARDAWLRPVDAKLEVSFADRGPVKREFWRELSWQAEEDLRKATGYDVMAQRRAAHEPIALEREKLIAAIHHEYTVGIRQEPAPRVTAKVTIDRPNMGYAS